MPGSAGDSATVVDRPARGTTRHRAPVLARDKGIGDKAPTNEPLEGGHHRTPMEGTPGATQTPHTPSLRGHHRAGPPRTRGSPTEHRQRGRPGRPLPFLSASPSPACPCRLRAGPAARRGCRGGSPRPGPARGRPRPARSEPWPPPTARLARASWAGPAPRGRGYANELREH